MIIIYHNDNKAVEVDAVQAIKISDASVVAFMFEIAKKFPESLLVWCHISLKENLSTNIADLMHRQQSIISFSSSAENYLSKTIGYVEESIFIKVNTKVRFPTWQMSGDVGAINASVLTALGNLNANDNLDYFLNSVAKLALPLGLLCYSEPRLLNDKPIFSVTNKTSDDTVFRFVKQHYRQRWLFLLFLNLAVYEKKFPFGALCKAMFYRRRHIDAKPFHNLNLNATREVLHNVTLDIIVPTIGRKQHLYNVLQDLSMQTHLPRRVIIVEQNTDLRSHSELDYINLEVWPFIIKHIFTHQAGACNARNIALQHVESEWVFFGDDDIRLSSDFLENVIINLKRSGAEAASVACYQKGESARFKTVFQWPFFGAGCSFVRSDKLVGCKFNMGYEFGFGEDGDFGMQLRNRGCDILYFPKPEILHLKVPAGGFREKPVLQWQHDKVQPKPSPTVMLYMLSHYTKQQLHGYKTNLFFKFYAHQKVKSPFRYFQNFQKQWNHSMSWAHRLQNSDN